MPYQNNEEGKRKRREYMRKWRANNPDKMIALLRSPHFREKQREYYLAHKKEASQRSLRYIARHAEKVKERERKYYLEHPEKMRAKRRKWANAHREYINRKRKEWLLKNKEQSIMRGAVNYMLRTAKIKKICRSIEYLGCSPQELREHIEKQFRDGMTWENHGPVWHVDHIIPVAWWDYKNDPDAIFKASHYSNLQPLFAKENCIKGARYAG